MKDTDVRADANGRDSFDEIYEAYAELVYEKAMSYVKNHHAAEEIMQETFLRYYIYMEHTRVENTKNWLLTTAKNITLNYIRDNSRAICLDLGEDEEGAYGLGESGEEIFFDKLWRYTF